jgi:hypothetical protein
MPGVEWLESREKSVLRDDRLRPVELPVQPDLHHALALPDVVLLLCTVQIKSRVNYSWPVASPEARILHHA